MQTRVKKLLRCSLKDVRAEGVLRGVQSGRVRYLFLCVRLRQNQVISSTQGSTVAVAARECRWFGHGFNQWIRGTEMV